MIISQLKKMIKIIVLICLIFSIFTTGDLGSHLNIRFREGVLTCYVECEGRSVDLSIKRTKGLSEIRNNLCGHASCNCKNVYSSLPESIIGTQTFEQFTERVCNTKQGGGKRNKQVLELEFEETF
jgi:hypothetical protein